MKHLNKFNESLKTDDEKFEEIKSYFNSISDIDGVKVYFEKDHNEHHFGDRAKLEVKVNICQYREKVSENNYMITNIESIKKISSLMKKCNEVMLEINNCLFDLTENTKYRWDMRIEDDNFIINGSTLFYELTIYTSEKEQKIE